MQSAFVEIGLERAAFLHIADIWEHRQNGHETKPIERILHEGQSLLVQVIKDPIGTKGARLSTQVSLAGRLLVYLPQDSHIGISQRIEDEAERESLRDRLQQLLPEGHAGGFIIRTMAETATEREMKNDIDYLTKLWADLTAKSGALPVPSPIYQDLSLAQRVLRDMVTEETARILVDSRETHQKMQDFARQYTQAIVDRIAHYSGGERPLFDLHGVEDEIEMARKRTRESLAHVLCEPCPTCTGRGEIKTAQTACYEILREVVRESRQFSAREFRILASQSVIDLFLDEESQSLAQLGDFIGKPISLQVETLYTQEQYDVILI